MSNELSLKEIQNEWHGTLKSYAIGFVASILLTATSFYIIMTRLFSGPVLIIAIIILAIVQAIFQLLFFLHLGQEAKPQWETVVFYFMILVLLIIAIGSLWIMYDLNDRLMSNIAMETTHD
jgi:cytochrome o ubiquinol oxidase subunit IV